MNNHDNTQIDSIHMCVFLFTDIYIYIYISIYYHYVICAVRSSSGNAKSDDNFI